ncbi:MAG TPA: hypothetical protein PLM16_02925, partial [Candidatus Woesebacteria bacterium]|nr:hypothetical protein [Candidatus Woesebacteria bacterium]
MQLETTPGTGSLKSLQPEYPERQRSRLQQIMKELLSDEGELIKYRDIAREIRKQDVELMNCSDADLQERFSKLKKRCQKAQPSELLMVEAYALITEVIRRQKGITMSDVQLMAAAAMGSNDGAIGEMKTGEGKTLTLAMVLFYRALFPHKSMLFTTNDYLAIDGAMNMGSLFSFFGMKVGVIVSGESDPATKTFIYQPSAADDSRQAILTSASKQEVYQLADVIYASGSEVLFDYAREQFSPSLGSSEFPFQEQLFARFLAIDEMDVFLAELALVPHIISVELSKDVISQSFDEKSLAKYQQLFVNLFLSPERINSLFEIDQVRQSAEFTEDGIAQLDELVDETLIECVQAGNLHLPASFHVDSLNEQLAQYLKAKKDQNQEVFHDQIQKNDYWLFFEQLRADLYGYAQTVLYCHYFLIEDINYFVEDVDGRKKIVVLLEDNRPGRDRRYQNWVQVVLHIREQIDVPTPQATQNRQSVPLFIQRFPQWCGITGTASEISKEMASIYGKTVVSIPTRLEDLIATGQVSLRRIDDIKGPEYQDPDNKTYYVRQDFTDSVHPNEQEKRRAIVCDAIEYASMG